MNETSTTAVPTAASQVRLKTTVFDMTSSWYFVEDELDV
jgi:hypothetical protein